MRADLIGWMERAERGLYLTVGLALVLGAAVFLGFTVWEALRGFLDGAVVHAILHLFDRSLLVLMLAQIVYTTLTFLREGSLQVEPVLVVGIIAVVRRILVVTAMMGGTLREAGSNAESFPEIALELGLLALTVLALAIAVYLLRGRPARAEGESGLEVEPSSR